MLTATEQTTRYERYAEIATAVLPATTRGDVDTIVAAARVRPYGDALAIIARVMAPGFRAQPDAVRYAVLDGALATRAAVDALDAEYGVNRYEPVHAEQCHVCGRAPHPRQGAPVAHLYATRADIKALGLGVIENGA